MPAKDRFWDEQGLNENSLSNGFYVSALTKEIEVVYVNNGDTMEAEGNKDF
jgi:hypothetical protein